MSSCFCIMPLLSLTSRKLAITTFTTVFYPPNSPNKGRSISPDYWFLILLVMCWICLPDLDYLRLEYNICCSCISDRLNLDLWQPVGGFVLSPFGWLSFLCFFVIQVAYVIWNVGVGKDFSWVDSMSGWERWNWLNEVFFC